MSNDDYNAGYDAGRRGSVFGPNSAEGWAGWSAGAAAARGERSHGSAEWLIAPLVLWPFVLIFYPVGGAATLATALGVEALVHAVGLGANAALRWTLVLIPTIAVCWTVVRMEQRWGHNRTYYLTRHVVRMLILALFMNGGGTNAMLTGASQPALPALAAMFSWPIQWLPVALAATFWQVFFMRAHLFRLYWNEKLKSWRFRPADFDAFYFTWRKAPSPVRAQEPIAMPRRWSGAPPRDEE